MEDCGWRAFWDTGFAVDALFRVNEEHRFTFVEAFDRTNSHAVGVFAVEAWLGDYVRHLKLTFPKNVRIRCYAD